MAIEHDVIRKVRKEADHARGKYGSPTSTHESLGVLLEEFEELKEAIHSNAGTRIKHEAIQVAAVAYRLACAIDSDDLAFYQRSGLRKIKTK